MTMNQTAPEANEQPRVAPKRRKRRPAGIPVALVALLLVIALFFGGLMGFVIANKANPYKTQLQEAQERISSLENTMTMMGFSEENANADAWVFDDSGDLDEFNDLGASFNSDNNEILWGDSDMLGEMLEDTANPVVVAEFNGGTLMSNEVVEPYNQALATQVFGFGNVEDVAGNVLDDVLQQLVGDKILYQHAEELGLTELNEADQAAIREAAEAYYEEQKQFYSLSVETNGMSKEEADKAVDAYLADELGVTLDGIILSQTGDYWVQKLYEYVGKDVAVTDEDVQAAYDELLAEQQSLFTQYPDEYEYALISDTPIAYNIDNYRRVKHILLSFENPDDYVQAATLTDAIAQLDPQTQMDEISELQSQLDALYADLDAKAESIIAEINNGADFDDLIQQYGQDEAMLQEPYRTTGYYVSANSIRWAAEFIEGSMMLQEPGQVSIPVHTVNGVHIIQYVGDVEPGAVPLEDIRGDIEETVRSEKMQEVYEEQVSAWITEADPKYYPERLQ